MASGNSYSAVDVLASRIKLKVRAYHDGDLVAFLNDFPRIQRGFFPLDRCVIARAVDAEKIDGNIAQEGQNTGAATRQRTTQLAQPPGSTPDLATIAPDALTADCTLEWITLRDKRNPSLVARAPSGAAQ